MGVLVTDQTDICLCGHRGIIHSKGRGTCFNLECDCMEFAESFRDVVQQTTTEQDLKKVLLGMAQAALISDIRWLYMNGFGDYTAQKYPNMLVLCIHPKTNTAKEKLKFGGFTPDFGNSDFYIKEYITTDRRMGSGRRRSDYGK